MKYGTSVAGDRLAVKNFPRLDVISILVISDFGQKYREFCLLTRHAKWPHLALGHLVLNFNLFFMKLIEHSRRHSRPSVEI